MEVVILYWVFSMLYCLGIEVYKGQVKLSSVVICIIFGWCILPMSLGTQRGKSLDE